jgi:hypothetical protein
MPKLRVAGGECDLGLPARLECFLIDDTQRL